MAMEHRLREVVDAFVARVQRDLDAHVQGLTADLLRIGAENQEHWRSTMERAVTDARQDSERGFKARLEAFRSELTREMDARLFTERAQLQAATTAAVQAGQAGSSDKGGARDARLETLERLLGAVRRIDESTTLTGVLEALADGASVVASRVAILLVDGDLLKPWVTHGYATGQTPYELPITASGLLTATVALKQTSFVKPLTAREITTPIFMQVPVGHTGLVVPLIVGGDVVVVLYADDVGHKEVQEDAPLWPKEIDLLVRHAAVRLENLTSVRTTEVLGS